MSKTTKFILLQASIVFNNQRSIFDDQYQDTKEGRNAAFRDIINQFIEKKMIKINPRMSEYILLYKNTTVNDDILYAQLAKKMEMHAYPLKGNNIQSQNVESYPPLAVFINLKTQQFAVELNSSILSVPAVEANIRNLFNSLINGFSMFINAVQDKKEFWKVVNQDDIQEISFDLVVPNLFEATEAAKDLVDDSKTNLNADSVSLSFKNKNGKLRLNMQAIDSFVTYSSTTGSW